MISLMVFTWWYNWHKFLLHSISDSERVREDNNVPSNTYILQMNLYLQVLVRWEIMLYDTPTPRSIVNIDNTALFCINIWFSQTWDWPIFLLIQLMGYTVYVSPNILLPVSLYCIYITNKHLVIDRWPPYYFAEYRSHTGNVTVFNTNGHVARKPTLRVSIHSKSSLQQSSFVRNTFWMKLIYLSKITGLQIDRIYNPFLICLGKVKVEWRWVIVYQGDIN